MTRVIHDCQQGSTAWHALRAAHLTASEAPAALGVSKHLPRSALLRQKHTGIAPEVDDFTASLFAKGHAAEAAARPIAEEVAGTDFFPVTVTRVVDGLPLLASLDGMTMGEDETFECKLWNEALAADIRAGTLDPHYTVQLDQQLLVSGANRCLFMTSDGTPDRTVWCWYETTPEKTDALIAGWKQFLADLAAYTPAPAVEKAVAEPIKALPALSIQLRGEVTASNLPAFKAAAETFIAAIVTDLKTDADFANAAETVKFCEDAEARLELAKTQALEQTASVAELLRTVDHIKEQLRAKRLDLSRKVSTRKDEIKAEVIAKARNAYAAHLSALNAELTPVSLVLTQPDFAGAAKNKRTLATLQDAVDGELAASKVAADAAARAMREKLSWFRESVGEFAYLFHDLQQLAQKPADDFRLAVQARIEAHQAAEAARKAQAERVLSEAMAKASAIPAPAPAPAPTASVTPIRPAAPAADEPACLNLGDLTTWLGVSMTAADIANRFGIEPAARVKAATRYTLSQAEAIRAALIHHLQTLAPLRAAA